MLKIQSRQPHTPRKLITQPRCSKSLPDQINPIQKATKATIDVIPLSFTSFPTTLALFLVALALALVVLLVLVWLAELEAGVGLADELAAELAELPAALAEEPAEELFFELTAELTTEPTAELEDELGPDPESLPP